MKLPTMSQFANEVDCLKAREAVLLEEVERLRAGLRMIAEGAWGHPEGPVNVAERCLDGFPADQLY